MLTLAVFALCATIDASHFAGALSEPDLSAVPVPQLTPEQLLTEQKRLEAYRTEFIGPVVLTAVGGAVVIVAAGLAVAGTLMAVVPSLAMNTMLTTLQLVGYVFMGLSGAALIAGGIVLTVGLVKLFPTLARRREAMERRDEIQRRLDALDPGKQPSPPSKSSPSPGDVLWQGPQAGMLLVTF